MCHGSSEQLDNSWTVFYCSPTVSRNTDQFSECARCSAMNVGTSESPGRRRDRCVESECGRYGKGSAQQVPGSTDHEIYGERGHRQAVSGGEA